MHYLKKLPTIAALSTLIVTSITAPAPAPQTTHIMTLSASGKATEADTAAAQFIGVITMFQDGGCDGGKTEEVELYGGPGTYGCYAVPWAMDSVEFTQGIGYVYHNSYPPCPSL